MKARRLRVKEVGEKKDTLHELRVLYTPKLPHSTQHPTTSSTSPLTNQANKEIPVLQQYSQAVETHVSSFCVTIFLSGSESSKQLRLAMSSALVCGQRALLRCQELSQILVRAWIRTAVSSAGIC